jgi:hypothetical protein
MAPEASDPKRQEPNAYLKYSSLAIQLFATIGISGWMGYKLDNYFALSFPAFLVSFVIISFTGMMYRVYKQLNG